MRNRTEAVTNNLPDSEEEEEVGDSEEDWQPEDDEKPKKRKAAAGGSAKKAKNGARGAGARGSAKKRKKDDSEEEEEESEPEEDESEEEEPKKGKAKGKKKSRSEYDSEEDSTEETGAGSAKKGSGGGAKNFPDKQGFLSLYIFRGDLVNGIRANDNLCLWRRDGSSLLQKYLRDKNSTECQWSPSMVYSCWEDRRKDEYLEVKVLCKGDLKNSNVTIVDLDNLEEQCVRERDSNSKFVSQKPQGQGNQSMNDTQAGNSSQEVLEEEEGDDGEEE